MDLYLSKPVQPHDLINAIEYIIFEAASVEEAFISKVFDSQSFIERVGGDKKLIAQVLDAFKTDAEELIAASKDAFNQKDFQSLKRNAHTLKGAASQLCANAVKDTAFEIEKAGELKQGELAHSLLDRLDYEYSVLKSILLSFENSL